MQTEKTTDRASTSRCILGFLAGFASFFAVVFVCNAIILLLLSIPFIRALLFALDSNGIILGASRCVISSFAAVGACYKVIERIVKNSTSEAKCVKVLFITLSVIYIWGILSSLIVDHEIPFTYIGVLIPILVASRVK